VGLFYKAGVVMNLKEMRDMVANILDYNPDVPQYNKEINRIINEVYLNFYMTQPWTWAQQTLNVYTNPDTNQSDLTITPKAANGFFENKISNVNTTTGIGSDFRFGQGNHEGDYVEITSASTTENNGIYIIDKIDRATNEAFVSKQSSNFEKVNWYGAGGGAQTVAGNAFQRYLELPQDCAQILSVGIRNTAESGSGQGNSLGHMFNATRVKEEELNYRFDITGTPTQFVVFDQAPSGYRDLSHFVPRAGKDFKVDTISGSPGWPQGTYEFFMAYEYHNIHGELSDPFTLVIGEGNNIPRFNTMDTRQFGFHGLRKRWFVRLKSVAGYDGVAFEEDFIRDLGAIDYTVLQAGDGISYFRQDDYVVQLDWPQALIQINTTDKLRMIPRFNQPVISRMRIRLHPRPTVQTPINIRYIAYPPELVDDYDQPSCPIDCHRYVVYRSLQEALFKHGEDSQAVYYEKKADKEMQKIEERHLTQRSAYYIKESIRSGPMQLRPFRTLTRMLGRDGT
tara:strand:- start:3412 stop:4938 length:1527 start_codon:yes stop_codon:yes gene_type:complete